MPVNLRNRTELSAQYAKAAGEAERDDSDYVRGVVGALGWITKNLPAAPVSGIPSPWRPVFLDVERELEYARDASDGKAEGFDGHALPAHSAEFCRGVEAACMWALGTHDVDAPL
jgi:hypothetical protein